MDLSINPIVQEFHELIKNINNDTDFYYRIIDKKSKEQFNLHIQAKKISGMTNISIHLNGLIKDCLDISLVYNVTDSRLSYFFNPNIARFIKVKYDHNCNNEGNLARATGTEILIKTGLYITKLLFPEIKKFILNDSSSHPCSSTSSINVQSTKYFIALFGSTYYEGIYSATLEDIKARNIYYDCIRRFDDENIKSMFNFDDFFNIYSAQMNEQQLKDFKELKNIYNNTLTFRDFFEQIKKAFEYDRKNEQQRELLCEFLAPWIHNFIDQIILSNPIYNNFFSMDWSISVDNIKNMDISIQKQNKKPIYIGGMNYKKTIYLFYNNIIY